MNCSLSCNGTISRISLDSENRKFIESVIRFIYGRAHRGRRSCLCLLPSEYSPGMTFSYWRCICCLNSIPTSVGRRRGRGWIDASFRLDSAYGTLLSATLIHLTPCIFPMASRRKSGTPIQLLRQVQTKILRYQEEKHSALAISLHPWQGQLSSCTAIYLWDPRGVTHHAVTWKLRKCGCFAHLPSLTLCFVVTNYTSSNR